MKAFKGSEEVEYGSLALASSDERRDIREFGFNDCAFQDFTIRDASKPLGQHYHREKFEVFYFLEGGGAIRTARVDAEGKISEISFEGSGCAISKASASMMTASLKGKTIDEAKKLFDEFHQLVIGKLDPQKANHTLGKLSIFSGIWQYPARVKCAILSWYTMKGALNKIQSVTTEK